MTIMIILTMRVTAAVAPCLKDWCVLEHCELWS